MNFVPEVSLSSVKELNAFLIQESYSDIVYYIVECRSWKDKGMTCFNTPICHVCHSAV